MSLTAIFFSVELDKAQLPGETIYMLMVFMAIHVTIHSTLSIVMYSEMPLDLTKPLLTAMPKAPTYSEVKKKPKPPVINPFSVRIVFSAFQHGWTFSGIGEQPCREKLRRKLFSF